MGRKKKWCEFCDPLAERDDEFEESYSSKHCIQMHVDPWHKVLQITSWADNEAIGEYEELNFDIPMNFCPVCGAKMEFD